MDTFIKTNTVLLKDNEVWCLFNDPQRVIHTNTLDDVLPALREIEDLTQREDWHAAGFISYEAATGGVEIQNTGSEPLEGLRYFGPDTFEDLPNVGDYNA